MAVRNQIARYGIVQAFGIDLEHLNGVDGISSRMPIVRSDSSSRACDIRMRLAKEGVIVSNYLKSKMRAGSGPSPRMVRWIR